MKPAKKLKNKYRCQKPNMDLYKGFNRHLTGNGRRSKKGFSTIPEKILNGRLNKRIIYEILNLEQYLIRTNKFNRKS